METETIPSETDSADHVWTEKGIVECETDNTDSVQVKPTAIATDLGHDCSDKQNMLWIGS